MRVATPNAMPIVDNTEIKVIKPEPLLDFMKRKPIEIYETKNLVAPTMNRIEIYHQDCSQGEATDFHTRMQKQSEDELVKTAAAKFHKMVKDDAKRSKLWEKTWFARQILAQSEIYRAQCRVRGCNGCLCCYPETGPVAFVAMKVIRNYTKDNLPDQQFVYDHCMESVKAAHRQLLRPISSADGKSIERYQFKCFT